MTLAYDPLLSISAHNWARPGLMAVVVKAYYDASRDQPEETFVTLAGYAGTLDVWSDFERRWYDVLRQSDCEYWHTADAHGLQDSFKDWTTERVNSLQNALINKCLFFSGRVRSDGQFFGVSCTINRQDHKRAFDQQLISQTVEDICVNHVVTIALGTIPDGSSGSFGKSGTAELFFDKGEKFLHRVKRNWERKQYRRLRKPLQLISDIQPVEMRKTYGVQAADLLAWTTLRTHTTRDDRQAAVYRNLIQLATPTYSYYYDYDALILKYGKSIL